SEQDLQQLAATEGDLELLSFLRCTHLAAFAFISQVMRRMDPNWTAGKKGEPMPLRGVEHQDKCSGCKDVPAMFRIHCYTDDSRRRDVTTRSHTFCQSCLDDRADRMAVTAEGDIQCLVAGCSYGVLSVHDLAVVGAAFSQKVADSLSALLPHRAFPGQMELVPGQVSRRWKEMVSKFWLESCKMLLLILCLSLRLYFTEEVLLQSKFTSVTSTWKEISFFHLRDC
ncbi:hypothetical protein PMAYCL1PPCAC_03170, partial [Pristionchus mayeri]